MLESLPDRPPLHDRNQREEVSSALDHDVAPEVIA